MIPSLEPHAGTRIGGRAVVRLVGRGGMAAVWEAEDAAGQRKAIKILDGGAVSDELEQRFRREFRALSKLNHPNIARVDDWGWWEGRPYYVMELVEGRDLKAEVEAWNADPPADRPERARAILIQVARALEYVHSRGFVHRDVTPGNIMVLPDGRVKLMDFGVVKEAGSVDRTAHGEVLGTAAYIAPEQINGDRIDARTDLYSLGAVLYLLLTGRRPFHARTLAGYLDKHLHHAPRPPHELAPGVPRALEEICLRLLAKDPADRFASATHLLHVLGVPSTHADQGAWPPALVSRTEELATLADAVAACRDGAGGVVVITAAAGLGKSRLAASAIDAARRVGLPGTLVPCTAGGPPLGAFRALVQALAGEGQPIPEVLADLYHLVEHDGATFERYAVFAAFREVLATSTRRVVVVDDLHDADPVTVELVEYLVRNTRSLVDAPVLWVLAWTNGAHDARLTGLLEGTRTGVRAVHLALRPLDAAAVEELVGTLVPDTPASRTLARRLHREGEGNPTFIAEMLRGLVEEGVIREIDGRRALTRDEATLLRAPLPLPRTVRDSLLGHLAALPPHARALAGLLAVARQELTAPLLAEASGLAEADVLAALDALLDTDLVRERHAETDEYFDLAQNRLRDLLYQEIPAEERRRLHRRIGETLERATRRRPHLVIEALAWHFEQGGVAGKAYPYLVRAGQRLLARSFAGEARACFDRAVAIEPAARDHLTLDDADRLLCDVLLQRAEAHEHLGDWAQMHDDLRRADDLARELGDERLQSRAQAALGKQARFSNDLPRAEGHYRAALELADRVGDAALRVLPLHGVGVVAWLQGDLEGARRAWTEELSVGEGGRDDRSLGYGYLGLGLIALCRGHAAEARRHYEQSAALFERLGLLGPLATARVNLVEIHHLTGNLRRGLELADLTVQQAEEIHHPLGLARGRCYRSLLLVDLGRTAEALDEAERALQVVRGLGDREEEVTALVSAVRSAWAHGDVAAVRRSLAELEPLARTQDAEGFLPVVMAWRGRLHALDGEPDAARRLLGEAATLPGTRWAYQECRLELTLARAWADLGDRPEATRRAEAALRRADACGFRYYALKAHGLAARWSDDEAAVSRHRRVAEALGRSLAANLARDDADRFLHTLGLGPAPA